MKNKTYSLIAVLLLLVGLPAHASWFGSIGTSLSNAASYVSQAFGFGSIDRDDRNRPGASGASAPAAAARPAPEVPEEGVSAFFRALFNRARTGYRRAMAYLFGDDPPGPSAAEQAFFDPIPQHVVPPYNNDWFGAGSGNSDPERLAAGPASFAQRSEVYLNSQPVVASSNDDHDQNEGDAKDSDSVVPHAGGAMSTGQSAARALSSASPPVGMRDYNGFDYGNDDIEVIVHPEHGDPSDSPESVTIPIEFVGVGSTGQPVVSEQKVDDRIYVPEQNREEERKRWEQLREKLRQNAKPRRADIAGPSSIQTTPTVTFTEILVETGGNEASNDGVEEHSDHVTIDIPGPEEQEEGVQRELIEQLELDVSTNQMERQGGTSVQSAPFIQPSKVSAKVNEAPDSASGSSDSQEIEAALERLKNCVEGQASDRVYEQTQHLYENGNQSDVKVFAETGKASVRVKKIADNVHELSNKQEIIALLEQLKGRVETQVMVHNGDSADAQVVLNIPAPVDDSDSGRVLEARKPTVDPHTYLVAAKRGLNQTLGTIEQLIAEVKNPEFMTDQELKQYIERLEKVSKTVLSLSQYWAPFEQFAATVKVNTQKANRNNQGALLDLQSYYNYPIFNDGVDISSTASVIERVTQAIAAADRGKRSDSSVLRQIQYCLGEPISKICYDRFVGGEQTWRNSQGSSEESASIIQKIQERMRQLEQAAIGAKLMRDEEAGTIAVDLGPGEATPERIFTSLYLLGAGLRRIKGEMDGGKRRTYAVIKAIPQAPTQEDESWERYRGPAPDWEPDWELEEPKKKPLTLLQRLLRKAEPEPLTIQPYGVDSERAIATEPSSAYLPYDLLRRRETSRRGGGDLELPDRPPYDYDVASATATAPLTANTRMSQSTSARLRLLESRGAFTR